MCARLPPARARIERHVPDEGPALLVCNHVSYMDALILAASIPRPVRFVMYYRIFNIPVMRWIFRTARAIPIAGAKEDPALMQRAFDEIDAALADGELIGIFPEGRLTTDGEIATFKSGVEKILARARDAGRPVPVVPMALRGMWASMWSRRGAADGAQPGRMRVPRRFRAQVEVVAGPAVDGGTATSASLEAAVRALRGTRLDAVVGRLPGAIVLYREGPVAPGRRPYRGMRDFPVCGERWVRHGCRMASGNLQTHRGHAALRRGRISLPLHGYHVTVATKDRNPVFCSFDVACAASLCFEDKRLIGDATMLAWVLMPDHAHWLLHLGKSDSLETVVANLKTASARAANRALGRHGSLWSRAFHDRALRDDESAEIVARYIIENPVRAGLVACAADYSFWNAWFFVGAPLRRENAFR